MGYSFDVGIFTTNIIEFSSRVQGDGRMAFTIIEAPTLL